MIASEVREKYLQSLLSITLLLYQQISFASGNVELGLSSSNLLLPRRQLLFDFLQESNRKRFSFISTEPHIFYMADCSTCMSSSPLDLLLIPFRRQIFCQNSLRRSLVMLCGEEYCQTDSSLPEHHKPLTCRAFCKLSSSPLTLSCIASKVCTCT